MRDTLKKTMISHYLIHVTNVRVIKTKTNAIKCNQYNRSFYKKDNIVMNETLRLYN